MRAVISIPAGLAEMDVRTFVVYSAGGSLLFNVFLTYLVYKGSGETSPLGWIIEAVSTTLPPYVNPVVGNWMFLVSLVIVTCLGVTFLWISREQLGRKIAPRR